MSDPVTFLHAGDLHYGAPLESPVLASSRQRRWLNAARTRSLQRVVDRALEHEVDFVLWSGDLYERRWRSVQGGETLRRQFDRLLRRDVDVLVARGNRDRAGDEEEPFLPEEVTVFSEGAVEEATVTRGDEPIARVLGWSPDSASGARPDVAEFSPTDTSILNVGVFHLTSDPLGTTFTDTVEAIREESPSGLHYWAIGHGHVPRIDRENPTVAVPGTPQGAGPHEPGPGGCLLVTAEPDTTHSVQFLPVGDVVWCRESLDLGRLDPPPDSPEGLRDIMIDRARDLHSLSLDELVDRYHGPDLELVDGVDNPVEGYLVRWTVRGRGDLHRACGEEDSVDRFLARGLNQRFKEEEPFLMAESVRLRTGRRFTSSLEEQADDDEVLKVLYDLLEELEGEGALQEELLRACGDVWDARTEPESLPSDRLPLTKSRYRELLNHAATLVVDRVLEERGVRAD